MKDGECCHTRIHATSQLAVATLAVPHRAHQMCDVRNSCNACPEAETIFIAAAASFG